MDRSVRRVAVTGMGVVSPLGSDLDEFSDCLIAGESAAGPITVFDASHLLTRIAAEARLDGTIALKDRKIAFAETAARRAIDDAQRRGATLAAHYKSGGSGVSLGIGLELFSMPDMLAFLAQGGIPDGVDPLTFLQIPSDLCLHTISYEHGLTQPPMMHVSACAAGTDAIGQAFRMVRSGRRSWTLAGGSDSMLNPLGVAGFCKLEAMTTRNDDPKHASRPFDRDRDGFLLGEGAGIVLLEDLAEAQRRGATIYAEILGYGSSFDAHGISEPHPEGEGAVLAMCRALRDARLAENEVGHINAHGTATPKNDPVETRAIRRLLGDHADQITVHSTKSMIGHLISASGAVELIAHISCATRGWVHPTINIENRDPQCDLDYVDDGPRRVGPQVFLKNSFGFGGQNATLAVRLA
jgi:3-oxoacyl-[acyl-carrier-protein] synthase II